MPSKEVMIKEIRQKIAKSRRNRKAFFRDLYHKDISVITRAYTRLLEHRKHSKYLKEIKEFIKTADPYSDESRNLAIEIHNKYNIPVPFKT